jgi:uncharacterized protein YqeY
MSPYKSVKKQREYQREWAANRRTDVAATSKIELTSEDITLTPNDLKRAMLACINELLSAEMEADKRSRAMAQLVQTAIKLFEAAELEDRISELEASMLKDRAPQSWQTASF